MCDRCTLCTSDIHMVSTHMTHAYTRARAYIHEHAYTHENNTDFPVKFYEACSHTGRRIIVVRKKNLIYSRTFPRRMIANEIADSDPWSVRQKYRKSCRRKNKSTVVSGPSFLCKYKAQMVSFQAVMASRYLTTALKLDIKIMYWIRLHYFT